MTNTMKCLTLCTFLLLSSASAQENAMKCESGKCSTGASTTAKKVPQKKVMQKKVIQKETISAKNLEKSSTANMKKSSEKKMAKQTRATVKQLFNVTVTTVEERSTAKEQVNYGYIMAEDSAKVDVLPWYSGFVKELYADTLYMKVKKGDALAKVYSPEVYKAKQDYLNSINYNKKTSMPAMLESAKIKLKLLGVDKEEIKCIETDQYADYYTTIHAPISGWIFEKNINEGAAFSTKKRLFEIVNLEKVWMEVELFQKELTTLNTLSHFQVKVKGLEKTFDAEKNILYPMLDSKEATATLRLSIENKDELLKPGMYAKVHAMAKMHTHLVIPRTAAMRKNGTWYAFLATDFKGEYEPLEIKVQPLDNKYFEVLSGLHKGDRVVNNALFMMDSDAQINSIY
jgi:Cu(I)/Ag(I) efflux system membrane fusion protein